MTTRNRNRRSSRIPPEAYLVGIIALAAIFGGNTGAFEQLSEQRAEYQAVQT
ncbi:MAG: hypothetical protein F6K19_40580, partial [Cyanothece sp. SIO1E1]|nr:hypothetical protein [Cyanothece sp. SIO1E1]NET38231.1 hypothetical protein [Cyanothece sp. SIO1E1]